MDATLTYNSEVKIGMQDQLQENIDVFDERMEGIITSLVSVYLYTRNDYAEKLD